MTSAAAAVARAVGYTNAGTIEFLLDRRWRVLLPRDEHAAAGRASDHRDGDRRRPGAVADPDRARRAAHARSRIAADAAWRMRSSAASTRRIPRTASCRRRAASQGLRVPQGPGVRDDSGAYEGGEVPIFYDPLISKLITWGDTRDHALARMRRALSEYEVRGIKTTIPFFQVDSRRRGLSRRADSIPRLSIASSARTARPCRRLTRRTRISRPLPPPSTCSRKPPAAGATAAPASRWRDAGRVDALR